VQRGFALIALLALAALISAFLIASTLNLTAAGDSNDRAQRTIDVLTKAKAALIAHAATEQWQLYKALPNTPATDPNTYFQPGALPCPDKDNDGDADCVGLGIGPNSSIIGRLPWKSMGIDDLRDSSGERLWYAVSHHFRKMQCSSPNVPAGCTTINSDTQACDTPACLAGESHLTVNGTAPASNLVAIVFAPGAALDLRAVGGPLQDRGAGPNVPANYLENFNLGDGTHFTFTTALPTNTFNDRLLVITQADLMAAVEPVVAAKIEGDVKPLLQDYFTKWGRYPFAKTFASPPVAQSAYLGTVSQTMGLLPVTNDTALVTWASATATSIVGSGTGYYDGTTNAISPNPTTCSISSPPPPQTVTCTVIYDRSGPGGWDDRPDIKLEILLANASMSFAGPSMVAPDDSNIVMVDRDGIPLGGTPYGQWSAIGSPPNPPTRSFVARADGSGAVTYTGRLQNARDTNAKVTITVPLPAPYLPRLTNISPTNPNITWFTSNQWYRQTYYAISPGFAPGGVPPGATCIPGPGTPSCCNPLPTVAPTPSCLTVNNLRPVAPANCTPGNPTADPCSTVNKQALLILAVRTLNGVLRPTGNVADYLENANLTAANSTTPFVYEHRAGVPTAINDRVVVVSPP